ncbi:hypothetical protein IWQ49_006371 [Labrenzia sp. EL_126]|nr:hypothetical protein [Labrenzia sp. EL_126]
MTNDEVHSAVVRWINASTAGTPTIKAHQSGDRPGTPYIMVNFTGLVEVQRWHQKIEYTETENLNSAGEKIVEAAPVIEMEWRFSVHAYGTAPTDELRPIVSAIKMQQPMEPLQPDLIVHEVSRIRNVPDWINNAWEPRAQMDFIVRGLIRDSVNVDTIDEYEIDISQMTSG